MSATSSATPEDMSEAHFGRFESRSDSSGRTTSTLTSLDDLEVEDIVDPFLFQSHPPFSATRPSAYRGFYSHQETRPTASRPAIHVRTQSLGAIGSRAWISPPPRTPLPAIPSLLSLTRQPNMISSGGESEINGGPTTPTTATLGHWQQDSSTDDNWQAHSFLSLENSSAGSHASELSVDDGNSEFYTAPPSPAFHKTASSMPARMPSKLISLRCPASRFAMRTSDFDDPASSMEPDSVPEPFQTASESRFSDSDEDEVDALATPTDRQASGHPRHKRGNSWARVFDKFRGGRDLLN